MTELYPIIEPTSTTSDYNALRHVIKTAQDAMMTCTIVQVKKVTTNGQVAAIGRVDVQPLVQMVDGISKTYDHVTVHNLPYLRIVGGKYAVILDPQVGDIGMVVSADRDISGVKQSMKKAPPGSGRRFNISDGFYLGAVLTQQAPTTSIRFTNGGAVIINVGQNNPAQLIVASDHVQMKKHGSSTLHITVDIGNGILVAGQAIQIGPDPYPNDPS